MTSLTPARRLLLCAAASAALGGAAATPALAADPLNLETLTALEAKRLMQEGKLTSVELTQQYIDRITALNKRGPGLNAVSQYNAEALNEARAADARRAAGKELGPADGLPILLKDLIDVKGMYTSNGNFSLRKSFPPEDSGIAKKLRASGVVILGKLGLTEWANSFGSQPSGFANLTGQVLHGLDTDQNPSGSSSGSGTAGTAALSALTVGTETSGSITSPSIAQALVGIRPTVGLVPPYGIGPISASQDTAGPMDRTVSNAALTLQSIVGPDPGSVAEYKAVFGEDIDKVVPPAPAEIPDYLSALSTSFVEGKRIGYNEPAPSATNGETIAALREARTALVAAGATVVDRALTTVAATPALPTGYESHKSIDEYYLRLGPDAPIKNLVEEVADNRANAQEALKFGNASHANNSLVDISPGGSNETAYRTNLPLRKAAQQKAINDMLNNQTPDDPADDFIAILGSVPSGPGAGYPQLTIPMGYSAAQRRAIGISVNGTAYSEKTLIGVGYVIEQATKKRKPASELNPSMYRCADTVPAPPFASRGGCNPDYDAALAQVGPTPVTVPFALETASAKGLQDRLAAGTLTSETLTKAYLSRIALTNAEGPALQAVRSLNPSAVAQARALDAERAQDGPRGPLHGLPVLLSDQIDASGLPTTGGSIALQGSTPAADSRIVAKLKAAGAIILGKTNVSELGGVFSPSMPEGYSSLAGQVLLPPNTDVNPGGSSAGAAAATASGLAAMTVGMQTPPDAAQSIEPALLAGAVALKPTVGRVSRRGTLPVAKSQDSPGPITRTVHDAAAQLQAIAGSDPADTATAGAPGVPDYLAALEPGALQGKRIAVTNATVAPYPAIVEALQVAGARTQVVTLPTTTPAAPASIVARELKRDLNAYLATTTGTGAKSLEAIIAANTANPEEGLKYEQGELTAAQAVDLGDAATSSAYVADRDGGRTASAAVVDGALQNGTPGDASDDFDAIVIPNGGTPLPTTSNGQPVPATNSGGAVLQAAADRAGYPVLTVPAAYSATTRDPQGAIFVGAPFSEAKLLEVGHGFEQATRVRQAPSVTNPSMFRCVPGSAFDNPYNCHPGDRRYVNAFAAAPVAPTTPTETTPTGTTPADTTPTPATPATPAPSTPTGTTPAGTTPTTAPPRATTTTKRALARGFTVRVTPGSDRRAPFRFTVRAALALPAGLTRATGCSGRIAIRYKAGTRTISLRRVFLKKDCTATSTVSFAKAGRFAGRGKLTVQVRFEGNAALFPKAAVARTVAVKR